MCTWNRTRSVLMEGLLGHYARQADLELLIGGCGTQATDAPPTDDTVTRLARIGIDVRTHRSRPVTASLVREADLVLTAEQDHVVTISTLAPGAFDRTFTLPEFVGLAEPREGRDITAWLAVVNDHRPRSVDYLNADVDELRDPTGRPAAVWDESLEEIGRFAGETCALLA